MTVLVDASGQRTQVSLPGPGGDPHVVWYCCTRPPPSIAARLVGDACGTGAPDDAFGADAQDGAFGTCELDGAARLNPPGRIGLMRGTQVQASVVPRGARASAGAKRINFLAARL